LKGKAGLLIVLTAIVFLSLRGYPQFTPRAIGERARWEAFLQDAIITDQEQLDRELARTGPWKLTLEKDGIIRFALWKNCQGRMGGFLENWRWEIAAYRLDKLLGLDMVPPTVEKNFNGLSGSCQLWVEETIRYDEAVKGVKSGDVFLARNGKRQGYIVQLFDNLIGNQDRHTGNALLTVDRRLILIDHSRTFRTSPAFTRYLPFGSAKMPGADLMRELPRFLVERIRGLEAGMIEEAVGDYLTAEEIKAVMARKILLMREIDRIVARFGEANVLY
jgi:hypothetical protein